MNSRLHKTLCPMQRGVNVCTCDEPSTEMTSLKEIKARLERIERVQNVICERLAPLIQGQGVLCERLDGMREQWNTIGRAGGNYRKDELAKLDCIQGALLHQQFKVGETTLQDRMRRIECQLNQLLINGPPRRKGKRK